MQKPPYLCLVIIIMAVFFSSAGAQVKNDSNFLPIGIGHSDDPNLLKETTGNLLKRINELTIKTGYGVAKRVDYTTGKGSYSTSDDTTKMGLPSKEGLMDIDVQLESGEIKIMNGYISYGENGTFNTIMRDTYKYNGKGNGTWLTAQNQPISSQSDRNLRSLGTSIYKEVLFTQYAASPDVAKTHNERQLKEQGESGKQEELKEKDDKAAHDFDGVRLEMTLADALKTLEARGYKLTGTVTTEIEAEQYKNVDIYMYFVKGLRLIRTDKNGYNYTVILACSKALTSDFNVFQKVIHVTEIYGNMDIPGMTVIAKYMEIGMKRYPDAKEGDDNNITNGVGLIPSNEGLDVYIVNDEYRKSLENQVREQAYQLGLKKQKSLAEPKF